MTFEDILSLVRDKSKTDFQLAADIHAIVQKATVPSALSIKPLKERKKREPRAPKPTTLALTNGADDHAETH